MKKFLYSILSIFALISFFSCNHLSEEKKSNSKLVVRLSNSIDGYSRTITSCPEFDISKLSFDFSILDAENTKLSEDSDYYHTSDSSTNTHYFTIAPGIYTIIAESYVDGSGNYDYYYKTNTIYGEATVTVNKESTPPVTIYVGLKKTEEGKGSFSYKIYLNDDTVDFSSLTATYELKPLWKDADESDTISGEATTIGSGGSGSININKTDIKSGFYKLTVKANFGGVEKTVALKDNIVEIADDQETTGEQTALNSSRTYYATTEASPFSGLAEEYPANLSTLIHILAESNEWENAKIYCKDKPDEESINADDVAKIQKEIQVYYNNKLYLTIKDNDINLNNGFVKISGAVIDGTETWNPASSVFVADRKLTIPNLIVSDHEVTRGEYLEVMGSDPSSSVTVYDADGKELKDEDLLYAPVSAVNWYDAIVYCNTASIQAGFVPCYSISDETNPVKWGDVPTSSTSENKAVWDAVTCDFTANGYRLPTEAEWEWLARGGEEYKYAGSNTIGDVAWYADNTGYSNARKIKTKMANGYRLYDMSGNVSEWCFDWYGSINSSSLSYGAESGTTRVIRGGDSAGDAAYCECSDRSNDYYNPTQRIGNIGFRVVRTLTTQLKADMVNVAGTTITGTETWTPASNVFVSGRQLTIPDLIVSDHEVTRGEYEELIGTDPSTAKAYGSDGNLVSGDAVLKHPVNYVSWYDALVYCNKLSIKERLTPCYTISGLTNPDEWGSVPRSDNTSWNAATCNFDANGYRLPTEAEWEWLARGGENFTYAGSNTVDDVAWYKDNSTSTDGYTGTREVKTKAPNGYGLYDMSGNVWEYCWDWYAATVNSSVAADGPESGTNRVARGSSINGAASTVTCANRDYCITYNRNSGYGFRVVRTKTE